MSAASGVIISAHGRHYVAQAGEQRLRGVFMEAGFKDFRRATETPFNLILEARP